MFDSVLCIHSSFSTQVSVSDIGQFNEATIFAVCLVAVVLSPQSLSPQWGLVQLLIACKNWIWLYVWFSSVYSFFFFYSGVSFWHWSIQRGHHLRSLFSRSRSLTAVSLTAVRIIGSVCNTALFTLRWIRLLKMYMSMKKSCRYQMKKGIHQRGIVASSAPSERVFSLSGNCITEKSSRLLPSNVDKLVFLHYNLPRK